MKIYTFYTDSHKRLLDMCLSSLDMVGEKNIVIREFPQFSPTGAFHSQGWTQTMLRKLEYVLYSILERELFLHSDCDIVFYKSFSELLRQHMVSNQLDLLFQSDGPEEHCLGFFACKPSLMTYKLFASARSLMLSGYCKNDQKAVNLLLRSRPFRELRVGVIGPEAYSIWRQTGLKVWTPDMEVRDLDVPIFMHHGNFTVGVDNKLDLLRRVYERLVKRGLARPGLVS